MSVDNLITSTFNYLTQIKTAFSTGPYGADKLDTFSDLDDPDQVDFSLVPGIQDAEVKAFNQAYQKFMDDCYAQIQTAQASATEEETPGQSNYHIMENEPPSKNLQPNAKLWNNLMSQLQTLSQKYGDGSFKAAA